MFIFLLRLGLEKLQASVKNEQWTGFKFNPVKRTSRPGIFGFFHERPYKCCTHRSGLHEITTMIRTFTLGLENSHACKWISDNFLGMLTYVLFLENCLKSICMHGCSQSTWKGPFSSLKYGTYLSPRVNTLSTWIGELPGMQMIF